MTFTKTLIVAASILLGAFSAQAADIPISKLLETSTLGQTGLNAQFGGSGSLAGPLLKSYCKTGDQPIVCAIADSDEKAAPTCKFMPYAEVSDVTCLKFAYEAVSRIRNVALYGDLQLNDMATGEVLDVDRNIRALQEKIQSEAVPDKELLAGVADVRARFDDARKMLADSFDKMMKERD